MKRIYRRRYGSDTWHSCTNCTRWPKSDYEERCQSQRPHGDWCNECKAKEYDGRCRHGSC